MPFSNYSQLQTAIASYLENDDVTGMVPDFITLAEARFNRELRIREMRDTEEIDIDDQEVALPANYLETIAWYMQYTPNATLSYLPPDRFFTSAGRTTNGKPVSYTIVGNSAFFLPDPGAPTPGSYPTVLEFYAKIPMLTVTVTTNFLIEKAPDLYLYASLLEAQPFLMDDARVSIWQAFYDRALKSLHAADARARYRPGGMMRPESVPRDGKPWVI